jgi:hypothetical protein
MLCASDIPTPSRGLLRDSMDGRNHRTTQHAGLLQHVLDAEEKVRGS